MSMPIPLVNGHRYSFASIEFSVSIPGQAQSTLKIVGIKSVNYKPSLEPGYAYGTSSLPIGRTRGKGKVSAGFTMYKNEYQDLVAQLSRLGTQLVGTGQTIGYMEVPFDFTCTYGDWGSPVITDTVQGFRIESDEDSWTDGNEPLAIKADGQALQLLRDGIPYTTAINLQGTT